MEEGFSGEGNSLDEGKRRSDQTRNVSRTDAPNSYLQIFTHTHNTVLPKAQDGRLEKQIPVLQKLPGCYQL